MKALFLILVTVGFAGFSAASAAKDPRRAHAAVDLGCNPSDFASTKIQVTHNLKVMKLAIESRALNQIVKGANLPEDNEFWTPKKIEMEGVPTHCVQSETRPELLNCTFEKVTITSKIINEDNLEEIEGPITKMHWIQIITNRVSTENAEGLIETETQMVLSGQGELGSLYVTPMGGGPITCQRIVERQ